ncbi:hypothetical protein WJX84_005133 [Apatococcus fuscideae]|uniref:tRNA-guanine(15) transglycosylase-like domain-containing protein n=1 Tax=Apatococcus fuscideae TaxID=2026836 RepID=A0AAW1SDC0_9CHLO
MAQSLPTPYGLQLDLHSFLQDLSHSHLEAYSAGVHEFCGLQACPFLALGRDPLQAFSKIAKGSRDGVFTATHAGLRLITPAMQMEAARAMRPDAVAALSAEVPAAMSGKAAVEASKRGLCWLDTCLQAMAEEPVLQGATQMWASVQGGRHIELRSENAAAATSRQGVQGVVIGGLGTGESPEQQREMLRASIAAVPDHLPRMASGMGSSPQDMLFAVSQGVDLLDGSMAIVATLRGHALSLGHGDCHSTPPPVPHAPPAGPFESPNADGKRRLSAASADRRPNGSSGAPPACSKAEVGDNAAGESMRGDFPTGQTAASGMGNPVSASPEALANSPESADHAQGDSLDGQQPLPAVNSANARRVGSDAAAPVPTADGLAERHALDEQSGLGTGSTQGTPAAGDLAHHPSVSLSHENAAHVTAHGDGTKRLLDEAGEHSGHRDESNPQLAGSAQPASPSDTASADKSVRSSRGKTQEVPAQPGRLDSGPGTAKKTLARLQYGPEQSDKDTGKPPWVLDLWRSVYAHDARPLVPGCSCYACRRHSRAYLHHLLQTQEMLAQVLLELHNTHQALHLFSAIQRAVRQGCLVELQISLGLL